MPEVFGCQIDSLFQIYPLQTIVIIVLSPIANVAVTFSDYVAAVLSVLIVADVLSDYVAVILSKSSSQKNQAIFL